MYEWHYCTLHGCYDHVKERFDSVRIPDYYSIFLHNSCMQAGLDMRISPAESIPPLRPNTTPEEFVSDIFVRMKSQIFSATCSH